MKDKLEKLFADWKVEQPPVPAFPAVTAKPAPGVYLAEKPDVTQTFFAMGELGGTLRDKDYPALQVAAQYSGRGIQQPPDVADPHQAGLRLRHRRGVGGELQSSRHVPHRRQHQIGIDDGSAVRRFKRKSKRCAPPK